MSERYISTTILCIFDTAQTGYILWRLFQRDALKPIPAPDDDDPYRPFTEAESLSIQTSLNVHMPDYSHAIVPKDHYSDDWHFGESTYDWYGHIHREYGGIAIRGDLYCGASLLQGDYPSFAVREVQP